MTVEEPLTIRLEVTDALSRRIWDCAAAEGVGSAEFIRQATITACRQTEREAARRHRLARAVERGDAA